MTDSPLPPIPDDLLTQPAPPAPDPTATTRKARTMSENFKIEKGELGFSLTDPGNGGVAADATLSQYQAFSCRVLRAELVPSQNFNREPVDGTFCDPATSTVTPAATTWTLEADVLQDPDQDGIDGLTKFLIENDSGNTGNPVYFLLGLADSADPKAIGQVYIGPGRFGGRPRIGLTTPLQLPVDGQPSFSFGTAADA